MLLLAVRFAHRGMGLISMLILARLLTPADFGFVAIIAITVQFFDLMSNVGCEPYIVQKDHIDDEDLATAFTVSLSFKLLLYAGLFLAAPFIADYYDRPQLVDALRVAALVLPLNGLASPGIFVLKRELSYAGIAQLAIVQKLLSFAAVMAIVWWEPSYWALIAGDVMGAAVFCIGSYRLHTLRPRLGLSKLLEQLRFSQWIFYRSLFGFARAQADTFLVSRHFPPASVGAFYLAKSLAVMPAFDIVNPAVEPLLAGFSRARNDPNDLGRRIRISLFAISFLMIPLCCFLAVSPGPVVDTFLGAQWGETYMLLACMVPLLMTVSLGGMFENIFIAIGRMRELLMFNVISTAVLIGFLLFIVSDDIVRFTLARTVFGFLITCAMLAWIQRLIPLGLRRLAMLCAPVTFAAVCASALTLSLPPPWPEGAPLLRLVTASVIFFGSHCAVLWLLARRRLVRTDEFRTLLGAFSRFLPARLVRVFR